MNVINKAQTNTATKNPCKLCSPFGASLVFKGIRGTIPILHGSQGCSTYIRRYFISHFREPVDIASSNFVEETSIFGGEKNLCEALENVNKQYNPEVIGVATTCLSETIGDDVPLFLNDFLKKKGAEPFPDIIFVSTPSYSGTHMDGFHAAVRSIVEYYSRSRQTESSASLISQAGKSVAVFPNFVSPEDIRHLKQIILDFGMKFVFVPDYSDTLDGATWDKYKKIPEGGTPKDDLLVLQKISSVIEFGDSLDGKDSAGKFLGSEFGSKRYGLGLPVGIDLTDNFLNSLEIISGRKTPDKYIAQRGRLVDAYCDAHKYLFGKKAVVFGEEDMVMSIARFLCEIGMIPVLCASGAKGDKMREISQQLFLEYKNEIIVRTKADFVDIEEESEVLNPDLLIGNSKGYSLSRKLGIPLVRVGFPIHDRFGASRISHLCYKGTQELFDRIVNAVIAKKQSESVAGYTYM
ncbi:MAG: nitrogenase [Candidatus Omnitrophica bacterium]|nr:nitrogenase [Candidatus Omnitrophota bacterium]